MAKSSKAFVADLPEMSVEQLEKLYSWGQSSCERSDIHMRGGGGAMTLVAVRKKSGTARDHMRLLRTNLQNWGVALPAKQTGWLRLVDERDEGASGEVEEAERNALDSKGQDMEIMVETNSNTPEITPVTKPAFSRCTSAKLELPLPPNLLSDL